VLPKGWLQKERKRERESEWVIDKEEDINVFSWLFCVLLLPVITTADGAFLDRERIGLGRGPVRDAARRLDPEDSVPFRERARLQEVPMEPKS
jgi:hypothetical protein